MGGCYSTDWFFWWLLYFKWSCAKTRLAEQEVCPLSITLITTANSKMHLSRHSLRARRPQKPASAILIPYWDFRGSANTEYLIKIAMCRLHIAKCYLMTQKILVLVFNLGENPVFHPDCDREGKKAAPWVVRPLAPEVAFLSQIPVKHFREHNRLRESCLTGV